MAENSQKRWRVSSATIALGAAALLAAGAVGIAVFRSAGTSEAPVTANAAATADPSAASMDQVVASLRQRLREDPDNHEGWYQLGLSLRAMENVQEAEQAFRRAMELAPRNADYTGYVAESMLLRSQPNPSPEAERLFRRALELQPGHPMSRYYLATLKDDRGDHRGAVDELIALLREAPAGAPWEAQVRSAVTAIAAEHDIDIANRLPAPRQTAPSTATGAIPGPTREQMEAARGIPPSQQDEMVQGMVERLASRLRQNPRDADGWIFLMRSQMVLNQPDAARQALASGLAAFPNDAAVQQRLRTAAQELGIPAA